LAWSQWDETSIEWRYGISRRLESIDKIKATKKVGLTAILETTIAEAKLTPGTQTCTHASSLPHPPAPPSVVRMNPLTLAPDILKLQDEHSKRKIEWYLHQKFYPLVAKSVLTEVLLTTHHINTLSLRSVSLCNAGVCLRSSTLSACCSKG
jgi:hypothetical protein